jgi:hypothetical protein
MDHYYNLCVFVETRDGRHWSTMNLECHQHGVEGARKMIWEWLRMIVANPPRDWTEPVFHVCKRHHLGCRWIHVESHGD